MTATPTPPLTPEAKALLEQLHGIHAPAEIGWWPPAPGWWILALTILCSLVFLIRWRRQVRAQNAYRKQAIAKLKQLQPTASVAYLNAVNALLKQTALTAFPQQRHHLASLSGEPWCRWLESVSPGLTITSNARAALGSGRYQAEPVFDPSELFNIAWQWLANHSSTKAPRHGTNNTETPAHV